MRQLFHRRIARVVVGIVLVGLIVFLGFGVYVANLAGALPWQTEPTRIPITPFAGIPGFSAPATGPTATPARATPTANQTGNDQARIVAHWAVIAAAPVVAGRG